MATGYGLQDILGWVALTKAVNAVKDGVPNPFPPWLFEVAENDRVIGNSTKFNRLYGARKSARLIRYGAVPRHRELQQEELADVKFLHAGEERILDPLVLAMLRDYNSYDNADKAKRLVANNVKTMGTLFGNARIVSVATALGLGSIYADANGNILPTSSGATDTYSLQIPSGNIGTVLDSSSVGIFGATGGGSWAVNSTDIPLQLRRLHEYAAQVHGYIPRVALYGKNVPSYMTQNDYVLDYLARYEPGRKEWLKDNTIPDGLFGITWVPVWTASYQNDTGTNKSLWGANTVTFIPGEEDRAAFWSMFEGSYEVPTTLNIQTDLMGAMNSVKTVFGGFGYAITNPKPPSISLVMGDTWFPAIKVPEACYVADTVS
jgi:hypothetical protein